MPCNNDYYANKMRQYRKRNKENDPTYYRTKVFTITLNGQQYAFLRKQDIKIQKTDKNKLDASCIKLYDNNTSKHI